MLHVGSAANLINQYFMGVQSLVHPYGHHDARTAYRAVALNEPLPAGSAHALMSTRDEDMRLDFVQAYHAGVEICVGSRWCSLWIRGNLIN